MAFFKNRDKKMAVCSYETLQEGYKASEMGLKKAVSSGDEKAMRKAMKEHQKFEYALLYKSTPEYKSKQNKHF